MASEPLSIGPCFLSSDEIQRINERLAESSKGHRLMAIIPVIAIAFSITGLLNHPSAIRIGVILVPQVVLLVGLLFSKPYRPVQRIEYRIVASELDLLLESRVNGGRLVRLIVPWKDIVGLEEEDGGLVLHLRSRGTATIFACCLTDSRHRQVLVSRACASCVPTELAQT